MIVVAARAENGPRPMQIISFQGIPVEFIFRALQPGEAVLATLKDDPSVKQVTLQVQNQTCVLGREGPSSRPFALIGLDLGLKPEPLTLTIAEEKSDGTINNFRQELMIEPKEFTKRNFHVNEAMLTPPVQAQERIRREQELVQAVYSIVTPEWLGTGNFMSPLPAREPFSNFGQQRIYNKKQASVHQGVDISAPWGTPCVASNAGRIVLASSLYLTGRTVIIDHGRGVFSIYCHFSKILVKRGDRVKKGEVIARVGNTGRSTGPHLHWGVRIFNSRIDPFSLVSLPLE